MAKPLPHDTLPSLRWPVVAALQTPAAAVDGACAGPGAAVTHSYAALAFYTAGSSRVEQNGRWDLRPGDVLLVPAGQPHRHLTRARPTYWGLAFCVPCFVAAGTAALLEPFERVRSGACAVVPVPTHRHAFLESLFRELADLSGGSGPPPEARLVLQHSLLTLILSEVDRAAPRPAPAAGAGMGGVVAESLRFIERNCLRPIRLRDVAAAVGRSPAHVTSALTQATGRSAGAWITSGRMAEARRLLLHSDEMVEIISERLGYADPTHFIRMFRREHGTTPAAWRLQQQHSSPPRSG